MATGTATLNPASYDTTRTSYASVNASYPLSNPVGKSHTNTTYAQWNLKTGSSAESYVYYKFDCSSIPSGATINSVSCQAKAYINQTNSSRINSRKIQLFADTTAKGSATNVSTSTSALTLTCGTWTRDELDACYIRIYTKRGTSSTTSTYYNRFYGATLTVSYTYEDVKYTVTTSIQNGTVISPSSSPVQVSKGDSLEVSFKGDSGCEFNRMTVNGTSVTPERQSSSVSWSLSTNFSTYQTYVLDNAKDGDTSTYFWSSEAQSVGKYILVTFASPVTLNSFQTYSSNSTDRPSTNSVLQYSSDGEEWTTVGTFQNANTTTFTGINGKNVKYARIYVQSAVNYWLVLNEITIGASVDSDSYYTYTVSSITADTEILIYFNAGEQVYFHMGGAWLTATAYRKISGVWTLISASDVDQTKKYKRKT